MSENYYFVSEAGVMFPVQSVNEEPDEDMIIAAHISTIDMSCDRQQEPQQQEQEHQQQQQQQQQNTSYSAPAPTVVKKKKIDTEEPKTELKSDHASEEKKTSDEVVQEDDNLINEDTYVAFGPGGDPGRDKALGELMEEEEEMPHKVWFRDDCYDSEDSYFDEDYFEDFDDCF